MNMEGEKLVSTNMGGEVAEFVEEVLLKEYECMSCGGTYEIGPQADIRGYSHPSKGLSDEKGELWFVSVECPNCGIHEGFDDMPFILNG